MDVRFLCQAHHTALTPVSGAAWESPWTRTPRRARDAVTALAASGRAGRRHGPAGRPRRTAPHGRRKGRASRRPLDPSGDRPARIADQPLEHLHRGDVVRVVDALVEGGADRGGVAREVDAGSLPSSRRRAVRRDRRRGSAGPARASLPSPSRRAASVRAARGPGPFTCSPTGRTPPARSASTCADGGSHTPFRRSATRPDTDAAGDHRADARPASTTRSTRPGTTSRTGSACRNRPEESRRATTSSPSATGRPAASP